MLPLAFIIVAISIFIGYLLSNKQNAVLDDEISKQHTPAENSVDSVDYDLDINGTSHCFSFFFLVPFPFPYISTLLLCALQSFFLIYFSWLCCYSRRCRYSRKTEVPMHS